MIRILHVVGKMDTGGIETMLMDFYRHLDRKKFSFDFVQHGHGVARFNDEIRSRGGHIFECPRYSVATALTYEKWWHHFLSEHPFDIVHCHIRSTAFMILRQAKQANMKTIAHAHATSDGKGISAIVKRQFEQRIAAFADFMIACSFDAGRWQFGNESIAKDSFQVIPNPVDFERYKPSSQDRKICRHLINIENNTILLGHVGRMKPIKNQAFLINLMPDLPQNYVLALIGGGPDLHRHRKRINNLGMSDRIHLLGDQLHVEEWLSAFDCFLFPSLAEGLGTAMVEAQASCLPVIASEFIPSLAFISNKSLRVPLNKAKWLKAIKNTETSWPRSVCEYPDSQFALSSIIHKYENIYLGAAERPRNA